MRAVWYDRLGAADEVLSVGEIETPEPGPGEVRIKVIACAINPADVQRRAGLRRGMEYPRVICGSDGAGIVDEVGEGVSGSWLGQRVWIYNGQRLGRAFGTGAEYIALAEELVTPLPDNTTFAEGACLGIPGMTAHRSVFFCGPAEGKTVLVSAGAGAVGNYAIQHAKRDGAVLVITTVSGEEKASHARAAGADVVINYRTEDAKERVFEATDGAGVDHVVEVDFAANIEMNTELLRPNGSLGAYDSVTNGRPQLPYFPLMGKNITMLFVTNNSSPLAARNEARAAMSELCESGRAYHMIAARFALDEMAAAHELVESGAKIGSVIVEPNGPSDILQA